MAFSLAEGYIDLTIPTAGFRRSMKAVRKRLASVGARLSKITRKIKLMGVVLGAAAAAMTYKFVQIASAAEETQAKFDTVFKDLADSANRWAVDFGKSVGRSRQSVKAWMGTLQDTFVPLGFTRDKAFELSKTLVKLGVDVASFNNKMDDEVIKNFTSALVGNHEAVRSYGIMITEGALKQEALNNGIKTNWKDMSNLEKVQLRFNLIMQSTADAQDDAIRTAGSYANQVKRLRANITNLSESIGVLLLPQFTEMVTKMNVYIVENTDRIVEWSRKTLAAINRAKNALVKFAKYIKTDWKGGLKVALDGALMMFKAFGKSLAVIMDKIYGDLAANIGVHLKRGAARMIEYQRQYTLPSGFHFREDLSPEARQYYKGRADAYAKRMVEAAEKSGVFAAMHPEIETVSWKAVGEKITKIWQDEVRDFTAKLPKELTRKGFVEYAFGAPYRKEFIETAFQKILQGLGLDEFGRLALPFIGRIEKVTTAFTKVFPKAATAKEAGGVGFAGFADAWKKVATTANQPTAELQKQGVAAQQKANELLKNIDSGIDTTNKSIGDLPTKLGEELDNVGTFVK